MALRPLHLYPASRKLLTPLLLAVLASPWHAVAQIASPSNAGGNSGNNASGSSVTPFSTPTFTPTQISPTVPELSVDADGNVNASQAVIDAVRTAIGTFIATAEGADLADLVDGEPSDIRATDLTNPAKIADVTLTSTAGQSQQPVRGFLDQLASQHAAGTLGSSFEVTSATTGARATVLLAEDRITVATDGALISIASTTTSQLAMIQFAAVSVVARLSPQAISAGSQLVAAGAPPLQTVQLMLSLRGLANATSLTGLSNAINTLNSIVSKAPESTLNAMASNPSFTAIRAMLAAARQAISS